MRLMDNYFGLSVHDFTGKIVDNKLKATISTPKNKVGTSYGVVYVEGTLYDNKKLSGKWNSPQEGTQGVLTLNKQ